MTRKTLCIIIALMVLSIGALLVANPNILGGFSSTLNGVPVQVTISRQDNGPITTMQTEGLLENWADSNKRFVRFMGIIKSVESIDTGIKLKLDLGAEAESQVDDVFVYPLDAPYLPTEYQEGHVYEFTGFLTGPADSDDYAADIVEGVASLHVYAFEIRHHGKSESLKETEAVRRLQGR